MTPFWIFPKKDNIDYATFKELYTFLLACQHFAYKLHWNPKFAGFSEFHMQAQAAICARLSIDTVKRTFRYPYTQAMRGLIDFLPDFEWDKAYWLAVDTLHERDEGFLRTEY